MTDPHAGQADWNAGDQTIPLVPDAGYAQPDLAPLPEETLVDPMGPKDPWASGPGLGHDAAPEHTLSLDPDPASAAPTAPIPTPAAARTPPPAAWPDPASAPQAPSSVQFGYGSPGEYTRATDDGTSAGAAYGSTSTPAPTYASTAGAYGVAPTPAPAPKPAEPAGNTYPQPPYASYPEPDGPAATIINQPYADSGYAGQHWPGALDPISYDYGYGGQPTAPHPNATTSMVLGILGLVVFTPLAPFAWYLAAKARREMRLDPARWAPSPMLTAGMVMGIIGTALMVFFAFLLLLLFGVAIFAAS